MTFDQFLLLCLLLAVAVIAYYLREAVAQLYDSRWCLPKITLSGLTINVRMPPAPPKPILLKERIYQQMGKIYLPFLLPEVPKLGAPVKRVVVVSYNGEVVKTFEDAPLTKCKLELWPDAGVLVTIATYTKDAAGNVSEASVVSYTAEDVYPPPAPPQAELLIDECDEVEDDEAGEIGIVEV